MAFSNYSNLFTSGLLSESPIASSSQAVWPADPEKLSHRRGSLPTSVDARSSLSRSSQYFTKPKPATDKGESYYFTFRPRNPIEDRSFLSLDLAESQSLRSASVKRTASKKSTTRSLITDVSYFFSSPLSPSGKPSAFPLQTFAAHPSPVRRSSRETYIPEPKPAPFSSLPDVPVLSIPRRDRSMSPMRFASPPISPISPATISPTPRSAHSRVSSESVSVTSGYRREQRNHALAFLEGRKASPNRMSRASQRRNFMSLTDDDESEYDWDEKDADANAQDIEVPELLASQPLQSATDASLATPRGSTWGYLPKAVFGTKLPSPSPSQLRSHKRSFMDSWFSIDVVNFIDLRDDRDSLSSRWRNIFEITSTA